MLNNGESNGSLLTALALASLVATPALAKSVSHQVPRHLYMYQNEAAPAATQNDPPSVVKRGYLMTGSRIRRSARKSFVDTTLVQPTDATQSDQDRSSTAPASPGALLPGFFFPPSRLLAQQAPDDLAGRRHRHARR